MAHQVIKTVKKFLSFKDFILEKEFIAVDLETSSLDYFDGKILLFTFSWDIGKAVVVPILSRFCEEFWDVDDKEIIIEGLKEILESDKSKKIYQNGKFDSKFLIAFGFNEEKLLNSFYFDTMLAHHLLDENSNKHGLKELAIRYTDLGGYQEELEEKKKEILKDLNSRHRNKLTINMITYDKFPNEVLWYYANFDSDVTFRLFKIFSKKLEKENLERLFNQIVIPLSKVLLKMEMEGFKIDEELLDESIEKIRKLRNKILKELNESDEIKKARKLLIEAEKEKLEKKYNSLKSTFYTKDMYIKKYLNEDKIEFNIASVNQLKVLFFDVLGLKVLSKTPKGNPKLDEKVLIKYSDKTDIAKKIIEYRNASQFLSTFLEGIKKRISKDGKLRTNYLQHSTVTGRLSSKDPNLQNIPKMKKGIVDPDEIRKCFVASDGCYVVEADYSQVEFRSWCEYSQDEILLKDIINGLDIHTKMAAFAYNKKPEDVKKEERSKAKGIVFGLMYGRGVESLSNELKISEKEVNKIIRYFFSNYKGAQKWINDIKDFSIENGYVRNYFGRKRRLPALKELKGKRMKDLHWETRSMVSEGLRQATNAPIQGFSADLTGIALIRLQRYIDKNKYPCKLLLQIHDSVISECPINLLDDWCKILTEKMVSPIKKMKTPFPIEINYGKSWDKLKLYEC